MDPIKNPFSPGAGSPPPELVGRDPILEQARVLLGRIKIKRSEKSMLLTELHHTAASPIALQVVKNATATVIPRLDSNFFRVRFDRLTPSEKSFLFDEFLTRVIPTFKD